MASFIDSMINDQTFKGTFNTVIVILALVLRAVSERRERPRVTSSELKKL